MFKQINKTIEVEYDTGFHYKIEYLDNEKLRWTSLKETIDGAPTSAIEKYYWFEIADNVYSINWIEESGISVSQVVNFNTLDIYAFIAWSNPKVHGGRETSINIGKLKFI